MTILNDSRLVNADCNPFTSSLMNIFPLHINLGWSDTFSTRIIMSKGKSLSVMKYTDHILQEGNVIAVHLVGAMMAFVLGVLYCFIQTGITKKMHPMYNGFSIWVWRLVISLVGMVALICSKCFVDT